MLTDEAGPEQGQGVFGSKGNPRYVLPLGTLDRINVVDFSRVLPTKPHLSLLMTGQELNHLSVSSKKEEVIIFLPEGTWQEELWG